MLQRCLVTAVAVAVLMSVGTVVAGEGGECPISAAMKNLPQIAFVVGEETTHCAKTAGKLAKEHGTPIIYAIGEKQFDSKKDAKMHLVTATEKFVADFSKPCVCEVSGTTTIAGQKLHCDVSAGKLASLVKGAMDGVTMSYLIGEEECHCPIQAKTLASESGAEQLYVVGKEKTACATTARLTLARAKYRAAIEAMHKAEQQAKAEVATETSET